MLVLLLGQAGIPLTSGFLGKWLVIGAAIQQGQYALGLIGMLAAAIAAFAYLRIALMMYMPAGAASPAGAAAAEAGDEALLVDGLVSDLPTMVAAGLTGRDTALALRPPPTARLRVPAPVSAVVAVCVAFTIFAGVSTPVLSWVHSLTLPWLL
jgi:NADH-quinone oxidoreductase subunit N